MMKRRLVPVALGGVGVLLIIPGLWFFPHYWHSLNSQDAEVALKPLITIPLDRIGTIRPVTLVIPDTPQWRHIRREWGEPDWIIAAVSPEKWRAYCLPRLGPIIQVMERATPVPLQASYPPYAYSTDCANSCLRFQAAPGTEISVTIFKSDDRPLPSGELIVIGGWLYTKDKLVGISLDHRGTANSDFHVCLGSPPGRTCLGAVPPSFAPGDLKRWEWSVIPVLVDQSRKFTSIVAATVTGLPSL